MSNTHIIYIPSVLHNRTVIYNYKCYKIENDNISIQNLSDLDSTDKNIILLITKGYSSSYAIWASMKKEAKTLTHPKKVMTYKNINTRVVKLFDTGLLEEVEQTGRPPHGRIDYKVNMKGLEELIPDIMIHPDELVSIVQYMDKTGLDKVIFQDLLTERLISTLQVFDKYLNISFMHLTDYQKSKLIKLQQRMDKLDKMLGLTDEEKKIETTADSLKVAKEIRQIINKHNEKYSESGVSYDGSDPYAGELLDKLNQSIKKYRPELADEETTTIDKTKKLLDETVAVANEAAETFRKTVEDMEERTPNFQEMVKHTSSTKKKKH